MSNPALWTSIASFVTAVGAVIGLFVHTNGPKHQ
jgi:hypothetical protein